MRRDPTWTTEHIIDFVANRCEVPAADLEVMWDNGTNSLLIDSTHEYSVQFAYGATEPRVVWSEFPADVIKFKRENGYYEHDGDEPTDEE